MINCIFYVAPYADLLCEEIGEDEHGTPVQIRVDCDGQNIRYYDDFCSTIATRKINFCPMCGRNLNDG